MQTTIILILEIKSLSLFCLNLIELFNIYSSDSTMKQFLLYLDDIKELGGKFVSEDLDDTHILIDSDYVDRLKEKMDDLMDKHSYIPEK